MSAGGPLATIPFDFDEEIISRARRDQISRARVYEWTDVAVVIGRGGRQEQELNTAAIAADGIPLYQRPGGGCSVVLDPGNLIISIALPLPGLGGIKSTFAALSQWVIEVLTRCGVPGVTRQGISDLVLEDRKIGGSCIYRTRGLLYYSTTLLVDHDPALVGRYLKHPPREPDYRRGRSHDKFMVSLKELGLVPARALWVPRLKQEILAQLPVLDQISGIT